MLAVCGTLVRDSRLQAAMIRTDKAVLETKSEVFQTVWSMALEEY